MKSTQKKISHYVLIKEIGKGDTGKVYLSLDERANKYIAIKAINQNKFQSVKMLQNFQRALQILINLNHKNVIKILGKEKTQNNFYIVLEYSNGGDLYEYLKSYKQKYNKPLNEQMVQMIINQVANGLEYMHKNNLIHREIKLENILINFDNFEINKSNVSNLSCNQMQLNEGQPFTVKLADFAYTKELHNYAMEKDDIYREIKNEEDSNEDIWSLGAITFELLIGHPPFYSENSKEFLQEKIKGKYVYPIGVDISIESISFINGLLQYDSNKRMNWEQIKTHPFLKNDPKSFHKINLEINCKKDNLKQFEVDSYNCDNFLWLIYKDDNKIGIPIDKIYNKYGINSQLNEEYYVYKRLKGDNSENKNNDFLELIPSPTKEEPFEEIMQSKFSTCMFLDNDWEVISEENNKFDLHEI